MRGLAQSPTNFASKAYFDPRIRPMLEMLITELGIQGHAVLHATRNFNDLEAILQAATMTYYEFQLLTKALSRQNCNS